MAELSLWHFHGCTEVAWSCWGPEEGSRLMLYFPSLLQFLVCSVSCWELNVGNSKVLYIIAKVNWSYICGFGLNSLVHSTNPNSCSSNQETFWFCGRFCVVLTIILLNFWIYNFHCQGLKFFVISKNYFLLPPAFSCILVYSDSSIHSTFINYQLHAYFMFLLQKITSLVSN